MGILMLVVGALFLFYRDGLLEAERKAEMEDPRSIQKAPSNLPLILAMVVYSSFIVFMINQYINL